MLRGGGWIYGARGCRSALRILTDPGGRFDDFGVRLALEAS